MLSLWLVQTWQPVRFSAGCSVASKRHVHQEGLSHWNGTYPWFLETLLIHLTSLLSCPWISTQLRKCVSHWLSLWPKEFVNYMASNFPARHLRRWKSCAFALAPDFGAKTQNPSIYDLRFKEFTFPSVDDLWMVIVTNCCCIRELLGNTCPGWSNTILGFPICSSPRLRG